MWPTAHGEIETVRQERGWMSFIQDNTNTHTRAHTHTQQTAAPALPPIHGETRHTGLLAVPCTYGASRPRPGAATSGPPNIKHSSQQERPNNEPRSWSIIERRPWCARTHPHVCFMLHAEYPTAILSRPPRVHSELTVLVRQLVPHGIPTPIVPTRRLRTPNLSSLQSPQTVDPALD